MGLSGIQTLNGYDIGNRHLSGNFLMFLYVLYLVLKIFVLLVEPVYHRCVTFLLKCLFKIFLESLFSPQQVPIFRLVKTYT